MKRKFLVVAFFVLVCFALVRLAMHWRSRNPPTLSGISGSNAGDQPGTSKPQPEKDVAPVPFECNLDDLANQILFAAAPIETTLNGQRRQGTCFFFQQKVAVDGKNFDIPFLVTNRHVVEGAEGGVFVLHQAIEGKPARNKTVNVHFDDNLFALYPDPTVDLAVAFIQPCLSSIENQGHKVFFRSIPSAIVPDRSAISDLSAMEDVSFVGYPVGSMDPTNLLPVTRKGITASPLWADFEGKALFLIDAQVYGGSSGSPVFILNRGAFNNKNDISVGTRINFLGILSAVKTEPATKEKVGLGIVIKSSVLMDFAQKMATEKISASMKSTAQKSEAKEDPK